jgi:ergothioneine biosynthesis protein EgtB
MHHEQQHQELVLTDIKHVFSCNPFFPVYREAEVKEPVGAGQGGWSKFPEGIYWIGHEGTGFAYDNESPRHRVFLNEFEFNNHPVTCGEYLQFMADGGYQRPELWLSLGWHTVREQGWNAPLYWRKSGDDWQQFTLAGLREVDSCQPVCHVSYFEADAFARWAGARLATEAEWEVACDSLPIEGNFADTLLDASAALHPAGEAVGQAFPSRMFGDVWEWTASPYVAYPGFETPEGALGEYNGKFMCNQFVLRGGSCATSSDHIRRTYRNFFPPDARWQFSGIRLARGTGDVA